MSEFPGPLIEALAQSLADEEAKLLAERKGQCKVRTWVRSKPFSGEGRWYYWNGSAWSPRQVDAAWLSKEQADAVVDAYGGVIWQV